MQNSINVYALHEYHFGNYFSICKILWISVFCLNIMLQFIFPHVYYVKIYFYTCKIKGVTYEDAPGNLTFVGKIDTFFYISSVTSVPRASFKRSDARNAKYRSRLGHRKKPESIWSCLVDLRTIFCCWIFEKSRLVRSEA